MSKENKPRVIVIDDGDGLGAKVAETIARMHISHVSIASSDAIKKSLDADTTTITLNNCPQSIFNHKK